jgi:hypothetical protein
MVGGKKIKKHLSSLKFNIYDHFLKCERLYLTSLCKESFESLLEKKVKKNDKEGDGLSI